MAATWKELVRVEIFFIAMEALIAGFLTLSSAYPILGVLLAIGGMGLFAYGFAGFCNESAFKE
jgi:hypothetical protein